MAFRNPPTAHCALAQDCDERALMECCQLTQFLKISHFTRKFERPRNLTVHI